MALDTVATGASHLDEKNQEEGFLFNPFKWSRLPYTSTVLAAPAEGFAGQVFDVANGLATVLQLVEAGRLGELHTDENDRPLPRLLDPGSEGNLERLSIATLEMLRDHAWKHMEWIRFNAAHKSDSKR